MVSYTSVYLILEIVSIVLCTILTVFMAKPYTTFRDVRVLGLPIGFGFLGLSFLFAAIFFIAIIFSLPFKTFLLALSVFRP
jgi:hypothetical protein